MANNLDGTLISPFSNITLARFGGWRIDINLDTEGIQDFTNFPTISVVFEIRSDLDVKLYTIQFLNNVVVQEWDNTNGFITDSDLFQMSGKYDSDTFVFSFSAHPDATIADGAQFWAYAQFSQSGEGANFLTSSNYVNGTQHPFQYTDDGATNGVKQTTHLITSPKRITIQTPYIEQEDGVYEHFVIDTGWVDGVENIFNILEVPITKTRVTQNIRASQPFHLKATWGRLGGVAIDTTLTRVNYGWSLTTFQLDIEWPTCEDANIVTLPDDDTGTVAHGITGSDAGDDTTILMSATSDILTEYQITVSADEETGFGTGTINCSNLGDVTFTRYNMSSIEFVAETFGFNKWQDA